MWHLHKGTRTFKYKNKRRGGVDTMWLDFKFNITHQHFITILLVYGLTRMEKKYFRSMVMPIKEVDGNAQKYVTKPNFMLIASKL